LTGGAVPTLLVISSSRGVTYRYQYFFVLRLNNPFSEKHISRRKKVRLFNMKHISTLDARGKCKMWRSLLAFVIDPVAFVGIAVTSAE